MATFQEFLFLLSQFWQKQGCLITQGYDTEVGAGTFNPWTFLRCLGPEPFSAAYVEPCRRPTDGRYGENPNRLQHYFQYQVVLKPNPENIQELYLKSLEAVGFDLSKHDIRFVHDDWESPTLGAWGLGWEVWMDGMEVTQFTYFQALGGLELKPVTGEITYGIERLAMYLQKVDSIYDLKWNDAFTYGDLYHRNEVEWSRYNFEEADTSLWLDQFNRSEAEAKRLMEKGLPLPAYDFIMKASHAFNMLDARGVISVTERAGYIGRIRNLSRSIAEAYVESRRELGFPLIKEKKVKEAPPLPPLPKEEYHAEKKDDFLLEIGSEELPATFVEKGFKSLEAQVEQLLKKEGFSFESIYGFGAPRRLCLKISGLDLATPPTSTERRGPAIQSAFDKSGNPTKAADGFFKSIGLSPLPLASIQKREIPSIAIKEVKGKDYLFAQVAEPSKFASHILAEKLPSIILNLNFPKKMRWADHDIAFARPIRWVLALLGNNCLPFELDGIRSSNQTFGHRQLSPDAVKIGHARDFEQALEKLHVIPDQAKRKTVILNQLEAIEKEKGWSPVKKEAVLSEVLYLSEYPQLDISNFDPKFLEVPQEVLVSEMVEHQKYFPLQDQGKKLVPHFVITCDNTPSKEIREGNERVLTARLSDGAFLYQQDLKTPLEEMNAKLKQVTYQQKLGSVWDKVERLKKHVDTICNYINTNQRETVQRAAHFCKADLCSQMVYEFPELQGVMGKYYTLAQGEDPLVAEAVLEHWMPLGENAPLPASEAGVVLSLAEKIDALLGCFAAGLKPSSSSDPYGLRRQAIGMIRIILNTEGSLPIKEVLDLCAGHFSSSLISSRKELSDEVWDFMQNRIRTVFGEYPGIHPDEIEASLSLNCDDLRSLLRRIEALSAFRKTEAFEHLLEVFKRAKGQIAQGKPNPVQENLMAEKEEHELWEAFKRVSPKIKEALNKQHFEQAYSELAALKEPLAALFDHVKILCDDPNIRANRLGILNEVLTLFSKLLDFSKIQIRATTHA